MKKKSSNILSIKLCAGGTAPVDKNKEDNLYWSQSLRKLSIWSNDNKGYKVYRKETAAKDNWVEMEKKEIVISTKHNDEISLYCLLHELGHVLLTENSNQYKHSYDVIWDNFSDNSLTKRVTILQEELDAWKEGLKLAESLKIKINRRKYEILKTKCIATYLAWIVRRSNNL